MATTMTSRALERIAETIALIDATLADVPNAPVFTWDTPAAAMFEVVGELTFDVDTDTLS